MLERVRAGGLLAARRRRSWRCSPAGGTRSACSTSRCARSAPPRSTALHVNYGLRDDSDEDERHCAALCERLGVELEVERPRRPEGPGNLQAWARDTRYAAAARLALPRGATIVTGHTADDQVETILYRLASSPSRRALLGMRPHDGRLARPLLGFTRAETTAYCEERGLAWRDDATNAEPTYARNRVRHGLLPELAAIHPAAARERAAHGGAAARRGRGARRARRRRARRLRRLAPRHDRAGAAGRAAAGAAPARRPAPRRRRRRPARSPAPPASPSRSPACAAPAPRCSTSAAASAPSSSAASCAPSADRRRPRSYI